jgi:hypothetical protein
MYFVVCRPSIDMGPSRRLDPLLTQERDSAVKRDSCTGTMIATEVHIRYDNEEMNIQQDQSMIRCCLDIQLTLSMLFPKCRVQMRHASMSV